MNRGNLPGFGYGGSSSNEQRASESQSSVPGTPSLFGLISKVNQGILKQPKKGILKNANTSSTGNQSSASQHSRPSPTGHLKQDGFFAAKSKIEQIQQGLWKLGAQDSLTKSESDIKQTSVFKVPQGLPTIKQSASGSQAGVGAKKNSAISTVVNQTESKPSGTGSQEGTISDAKDQSKLISLVDYDDDEPGSEGSDRTSPKEYTMDSALKELDMYMASRKRNSQSQQKIKYESRKEDYSSDSDDEREYEGDSRRLGKTDRVYEGDDRDYSDRLVSKSLSDRRSPESRSPEYSAGFGDSRVNRYDPSFDASRYRVDHQSSYGSRYVSPPPNTYAYTSASNTKYMGGYDSGKQGYQYNKESPYYRGVSSYDRGAYRGYSSDRDRVYGASTSYGSSIGRGSDYESFKREGYTDSASRASSSGYSRDYSNRGSSVLYTSGGRRVYPTEDRYRGEDKDYSSSRKTARDYDTPMPRSGHDGSYNNRSRLSGQRRRGERYESVSSGSDDDRSPERDSTDFVRWDEDDVEEAENVDQSVDINKEPVEPEENKPEMYEDFLFSDMYGNDDSDKEESADAPSGSGIETKNTSALQGQSETKTLSSTSGFTCKDCNITCPDKALYDDHLSGDSHLLTLQKKAQELFQIPPAGGPKGSRVRKSRFDTDDTGKPLSVGAIQPPGVVAIQPPTIIKVIPHKPKGPLEAYNIRSRRLRLMWGKLDYAEERKIDQYLVEYRNARETHWVTVGHTSEHEYLVDGLQDNTDYLFRVSSMNGTERSEYLESILITTAKREGSPYRRRDTRRARSRDRKRSRSKDRSRSAERSRTSESKDKKETKELTEEEKKAEEERKARELDEAKEFEKQMRSQAGEEIMKIKPGNIRAKNNENEECMFFKHFAAFRDAALLGLDFIYEIISYNPAIKPYYICKLCSNKGTGEIMIKHVNGFAHKMACIKMYNPVLFDAIEMLPTKKDKMAKATFEAKLIEDKVGRSAVNVMRMLNPSDFDGKVVFKEPVPVKAPASKRPVKRNAVSIIDEPKQEPRESEFMKLYTAAVEAGALPDKAIVGLNSVQEYLHPTNAELPRYICGLCKCLLRHGTILFHLIGKKHRLQFLKESYPELHEQLSKTKKFKMELPKIVADIEAKNGIGKVRITVAKSDKIWRQRPNKDGEMQGFLGMQGTSNAGEEGAKGVKFGIKKVEEQSTTVMQTNVLEEETKQSNKEILDWTKENEALQAKIQNQSIIKSTRQSRFISTYGPTFNRYAVIGMQWITEFQKPDPKAEPWFMCFMCQQKLQWKNIIDHVTSTAHRFNYLKNSHKDMSKSLYEQIGSSRTGMRPLVEKFAQKVAQIEGPPKEVEVMIELNINTEALKSVMKVKDTVKSTMSTVPAATPVMSNVASSMSQPALHTTPSQFPPLLPGQNLPGPFIGPPPLLNPGLNPPYPLINPAFPSPNVSVGPQPTIPPLLPPNPGSIPQLWQGNVPLNFNNQGMNGPPPVSVSIANPQTSLALSGYPNPGVDQTIVGGSNPSLLQPNVNMPGESGGITSTTGIEDVIQKHAEEILTKQILSTGQFPPPGTVVQPDDFVGESSYNRDNYSNNRQNVDPDCIVIDDDDLDDRDYERRKRSLSRDRHWDRDKRFRGDDQYSDDDRYYDDDSNYDDDYDRSYDDNDDDDDEGGGRILMLFDEATKIFGLGRQRSGSPDDGSDGFRDQIDRSRERDEDDNRFNRNNRNDDRSPGRYERYRDRDRDRDSRDRRSRERNSRDRSTRDRSSRNRDSRDGDARDRRSRSRTSRDRDRTESDIGRDQRRGRYPNRDSQEREPDRRQGRRDRQSRFSERDSHSRRSRSPRDNQRSEQNRVEVGSNRSRNDYSVPNLDVSTDNLNEGNDNFHSGIERDGKYVDDSYSENFEIVYDDKPTSSVNSGLKQSGNIRGGRYTSNNRRGRGLRSLRGSLGRGNLGTDTAGIGSEMGGASNISGQGAERGRGRRRKSRFSDIDAEPQTGLLQEQFVGHGGQMLGDGLQGNLDGGPGMEMPDPTREEINNLMQRAPDPTREEINNLMQRAKSLMNIIETMDEGEKPVNQFMNDGSIGMMESMMEGQAFNVRGQGLGAPRGRILNRGFTRGNRGPGRGLINQRGPRGVGGGPVRGGMMRGAPNMGGQMPGRGNMSARPFRGRGNFRGN